jgi:hypothetical protein
MADKDIKILILGGYGTFGGRLAGLLAGEPSLTLVIAGRSFSKAEEFCRRLSSEARLVPLAFDRNGDIVSLLKDMEPDIVVDASGPFQNYGDDPFRIVKACIAHSVHYMDLADGSAFVKGIRQFNDAAKSRNIFVLSGMSSFPVLTAAVVRVLSRDLAYVHVITGGIAPSPYAGVGLNVIRAVMGYAGQPVALLRGGAKSTGYALTETMRYTVRPPGRLPLYNLRFSLVDVPDLQILPDDWPELDAIWIGVAPVPEILHRMLNGLSRLVRRKLIPSLLPWARLMHNVINIVRWGEHRGGMFVSVKGTGLDGRMKERSWHLLAEGNDGPNIPSMAAEAIIRHMLEGKTPAPGARPGTHDLELADYDALFKRRTIYAGFRDMTPLPADAPLYQRLLGDAWPALPEPLRVMHSLKDTFTARGTASVERGTGVLARAVATITRFPQAGENIPVTVNFRLHEGKETWQRIFAGKSFSSVQSEGKGRSEGLLSERFGPFTFGLALVCEDQKLRLVVRRWDFLGLPLPLWLAPRGDAYESVEDGRFHFHVEIAHPLTGLIVRYRGWLEPESNA